MKDRPAPGAHNAGLTPGWNADGTKKEPTVEERVAKLEETIALLERVMNLEHAVAVLIDRNDELTERVGALEKDLRTVRASRGAAAKG